MNIIRAGTGEIDILAPLFAAYRRFYEQASEPVAEREYLAARLNKQQAVVFLALDAEEPASGLGFVLLYPGFDSVELIATWTLHDLYVEAASRKDGVGRGLMNQAADFCRASGAGRIDLATAVTNTTAQPLYESLGYQRDREFYHYSLSLNPQAIDP